MKKSRYTESQIFQILKEAEAGVPVPELCRKHGMSGASFYKWRSQYGGMEISSMKRLKELEEENARLKKMYAEEKLKAEIVAEALEKSAEAVIPVRDNLITARRLLNDLIGQSVRHRSEQRQSAYNPYS